MSDLSPWTPKILSDFEWGMCVGAIEAIQRSDKPIAEVCAVTARLADLEADLQGCLDFHRDLDIKYWTREVSPGRYRYGFYREPWALQAIDFLARAELSPTDRAWISGLVFGYRPRAIQKHIEQRSNSGSLRRGSRRTNQEKQGHGRRGTDAVSQPDDSLVPIGTWTQWGRIEAVGFVRERYYWIRDQNGLIAMIPAQVIECPLVRAGDAPPPTAGATR